VGTVRRRLARMFGVNTEEIAITRTRDIETIVD
jgi:hypothetical protein